MKQDMTVDTTAKHEEAQPDSVISLNSLSLSIYQVLISMTAGRATEYICMQLYAMYLFNFITFLACSSPKTQGRLQQVNIQIKL